MADPHDMDIPVEDAPPSSGEVPNPPDPGGGMAEQGGNHESGGEGLGSGHSGSNRDVADRPIEEIVPDDGGEGHGEPGGAAILPGASLSVGLRRASSFSETGVPAIQKKWKRSVSLPVINWEDSQFSARYANGERNCKKFQLVEADHDGAWFKAIEANDHVSLWRILKGKEDDASRVALCQETGKDGRTALHVAAMQGCFRLAKQLIDLMCHAYDPSGVLERPSKELHEFTGAKDRRSGLTALAIAKDIRRNTSISEYIRYVRMEPQEKEKYGGMFEAYQGTEWDTTLAKRDRHELGELLESNPRFLLQTCSTNGLSVLDVAIIIGADDLLELVVRLFEPGGDKISWPEESHFPSELTWKQLAVRHFDEDPRFSGRLSLENSAKLGVPNAETRRSPGPVTSAVQLAEEFGSSAEIKGLLSKVGKHVEHLPVDGEEVNKSGDVEVCQFVEADHVDPWFKAIEARDCLSLMTQLQSVHAVGGDALYVPLLNKTGEGCRTALHVAAMQGCFRLAKQLIDLICEKYPRSENLKFIEGYDAYGKEGIDIRERLVYLSKDALDFTRAKDGRSGLTALEMANDIIGNTSISQYMLYMGMEPTKKEKYKYRGVYEAYQGTEWHTALAEGDCGMLRKLLGCNSRFLLQTCSTNGLSVLDVAIMKDDKELVKMVVCVFGPRRDKILWAAESYFPSELRWEQIARFHYDEHSRFHKLCSSSNYAKLGLSFVKTKKSLRSVRSAQDLAEKIGSSTEIKRLLGEVGGHVPGMTVDGEGIDPRLLGSLSKEGVFKSGDAELLESLLPEYNLLGQVAYYTQDGWNSEWTAGFLADVDYNFEDKSSLHFSILRFHYACKHYQLCEEFIGGKVRNYRGRTRRLLEGLFAMCDSQGRTPFHTVVDHYNDKEPFKEVLQGWSICSMLYKHDARGRSPTLRAVTKQFLEGKTKVSNLCVQIEENILSKDPSTLKHQLSPHHGAHSLDEWLFLSTLLFQNEHVLRFIIENNEASILKTLFDGAKMPSFGIMNNLVQIQPLLIAAALGNQAILRLCLKIFNPMIEDEDGKTALHYAADRNIFKYFSLPLFFYCSIENYQKVEDQWMGRHKDVIETQSNRNRDTHQKVKDQLVERGKDEIQSNRNQKTHQGPSQNSQSTTFAGRRACVLMLRQAGVDLSQEDKRGHIPDPGNSTDASFRIWWYDTLDKDAGEKKNSFNQAGNALSVVGTLVAATSYIGPLQPPLSYDRVTGYVETSKLLVKVFMVSNTLAFYLAVASVMFAVVPSLPMPQEGVLDELKRAQQTVTSSLFLLLASIGCILVSFAAASAVVVEGEHYYGASDLLLKPSLIGWFFCLIAMAGFFIRVMRLVFYKNSVVRRVYKFSFSAFCKKIGSCTVPSYAA